jgi:hypothetical protein
MTMQSEKHKSMSKPGKSVRTTVMKKTPTVQTHS